MGQESKSYVIEKIQLDSHQRTFHEGVDLQLQL